MRPGGDDLYQELIREAFPPDPFAQRRSRPCDSGRVRASRLRAVRRADDKQWRHGLSLFGDLKYPAGFKHFDYVNPAAPKAGTVRLGVSGTFDNFNVVIRGVKGIDRGRHRLDLSSG